MHFDAQRERKEKAGGKERTDGETKAIGENEGQGNGGKQGRGETAQPLRGVGTGRRRKNRRSGKFSTRKKSESRPALVSIAGCAVSLTFPLFVKRSAGRVLFAFK